MSQGGLITVVLLCLGGLAVAVEKTIDLSHQNQDLTREVQKDEDQIKQLKLDLLQAHKMEQTEYLSERTTVENLKDKLKQQQDAVALADDRLRKDRNEGAGGREVPALQDRLQQQRSVIDDLQNSLKGVQEKQRQLDEQDRANRSAYNQNGNASDAELKAQIQTLDANLKAMIDQANQLKKQRDYSSQQQLQTLNTQIAQQKDQIQQAKAQRTETQQEYVAAKTGSHSDLQAQKQQLKSSQQDLQNQLGTEKASLARMQKDVQSGQASKKSREDEIKSAEADLNEKKSAMQETLNSLQQEEQKLHTLESPSH
jgi:chromosome segregation ATPase